MFALAMTLVWAAFLGGCDVPAQIVWSPDGTLAAYRSGESAFLINQNGAVLQPLGRSLGGFVWSADSQSLYFATSKDHGTPTPLHMEWIGPPDAATRPAATRPSTTMLTGTNGLAASSQVASQPAGDDFAEPEADAVVSVLNHGKTTDLFRLADVDPWHLQLSPDGQWLAAIASEKDGVFQLFVYSFRSGKLYELSRVCGLGACFTGPNTLAFVEANGLDPVGQVNGHIVQVKLDDSAAALPRKVLLETILPLTRWMEPCEGGLLFTSAPRAFPAPPVPPSSRQLFKLFHFSRADGGLTVLGDDVGELFDASPDGKRILFERLMAPDVPATIPATTSSSTLPAISDDLCVMNANGSDPHVLRSLGEYSGEPKPPMWPAWRGNDQITFIAPADAAHAAEFDGHERKVVDVIQYEVTVRGTLAVVQSLSAKWKGEMKPYFHRPQ